MPAHKRKRRERTHEWQDIQQATLWPEQEIYGRLRPIVLFGETAASRARETGASERTLHHQAKLFEQEGMASLFHKAQTTEQEPGRSLPPDMCQMIVNLKAEYPGFSLREIATICFLRFDRKLSHHTIQRVLADGPQPTVSTRRYPPYAQIADPYQRRRAIVDLHAEGWSNTAISTYLHRIELEEDRKQIKQVSNPHLATTPFRSPQLTLLDVGPDEWRLYWRAPSYQPRRRLHHPIGMVQLPLFELPSEGKAVGAEGPSQGQQARFRLHLVSRRNPS